MTTMPSLQHAGPAWRLVRPAVFYLLTMLNYYWVVALSPDTMAAGQQPVDAVRRAELNNVRFHNKTR